jgi:hypothetical protein
MQAFFLLVAIRSLFRKKNEEEILNLMERGEFLLD